MSATSEGRPERQPRVVRSLVAVAALLGVSTVILGAVLLRGGAEVTTQPHPAPQAAAPTAGRSAAQATMNPLGERIGGRPTVASLAEPLRAAAVEVGDDPAQVAPSDAELAAADIAGPGSQVQAVMLDRLREGYERYGMPFPTLPDS